MKKITAIILSMIMIFSIASIAVYAENEETYEIVFADFPYDVSPYRNDYVGKYEGYEYGVDYWFTITNKDGTTTDIKGYPFSIEVEAGDAFEFVVNYAEYIEPSSVKVMAFPVGADNDADFYNTITGEPNGGYYIKRSAAGTYGLVPKKDMTICLSEFHLYNKAYLLEFPESPYYTINRVYLVDPDNSDSLEGYAYDEMGNTEIAYQNETYFFEVRIPRDGKYKYNYETYHVYYKEDSLLAESVYLKRPASEKDETPAINKVVASNRYLIDRGEVAEDEDQVEIFAIENLPANIEIKVANVVKYDISMLAEFLSDFDLMNLESIDLSTVDLEPMLEYILRIFNLLVKILNSFGLDIGLGDLLG